MPKRAGGNMVKEVRVNKTDAHYRAVRKSRPKTSSTTTDVQDRMSTARTVINQSSDKPIPTRLRDTNIKNADVAIPKSEIPNPLPVNHGDVAQEGKALSVISTFLSGILAISASQMLGAPFKYADPEFYKRYMAWTKESFAILMTTITQFWAPTVINVSGDESMKDQLYHMSDGTLKCNFPHRLVLMANHQLYTDWLYLWWIAYTNKMHGGIYIIMKESLRHLPLLGWAAQSYKFIFLSRKWEADKPQLKRALNHLKQPNDPMWLLIFPEGTNLSAITRKHSSEWSLKSGIPDMQHLLLPRMTGLQFCLQELQKTTNWLYDCTLVYEGIPKGQYGQDIFTLKSSFLEGNPPKSVNLYWRRFKISNIPMSDDVMFARWLLNRWREKDYILEYFSKFKRFPANDAISALQASQGKMNPIHAKAISTEVKGRGWNEFLDIFQPLTEITQALSQFDLLNSLEPKAFIELVKAEGRSRLNFMGSQPNGGKSTGKTSQTLKRVPERINSRSGGRSKKTRPTIQSEDLPKPSVKFTAAVHDRPSNDSPADQVKTVVKVAEVDAVNTLENSKNHKPKYVGSRSISTSGLSHSKSCVPNISKSSRPAKPIKTSAAQRKA